MVEPDLTEELRGATLGISLLVIVYYLNGAAFLGLLGVRVKQAVARKGSVDQDRALDPRRCEHRVPIGGAKGARDRKLPVLTNDAMNAQHPRQILDPNDAFYNSIGGGDTEVPEWNYSLRGMADRELLAAAAEAGFEAHGLDISEAAAEMCRARGLRAVSGDFLTAETDAPFDVITMWDVIEHLPDPVSFVRRAVEQQRLHSHHRYLLSERDERFDHYGIIGESRPIRTKYKPLYVSVCSIIS